MRNRPFLILSAVVVVAYARGVNAQSPPRMLSASSTALACAPSLTLTPAPVEGLRVVASQDSSLHSLFGPGELVVINGGTAAGVQSGQEYFVRRPYEFGRPSSSTVQTVQTTGWLRIVSVNGTTAIAQLDTTCDAVRAGDYLEPFAAPVEPAASASPVTFATLDFSSLGRVMFGDEQRRLGGAGDFMLVEYGAAAVVPGTRVAVYRDLHTPDLPLTAVGEGVIVSVANGIPLMLITASRDAVVSGDYVVLHK